MYPWLVMAKGVILGLTTPCTYSFLVWGLVAPITYPTDYLRPRPAGFSQVDVPSIHSWVKCADEVHRLTHSPDPEETGYVVRTDRTSAHDNVHDDNSCWWPRFRSSKPPSRRRIVFKGCEGKLRICRMTVAGSAL